MLVSNLTKRPTSFVLSHCMFMSLFCVHSNGAIVVYDITDDDSFTKVSVCGVIHTFMECSNCLLTILQIFGNVLPISFTNCPKLLCNKY